jgi:Domain of unknown function (DUF4326)
MTVVNMKGIKGAYIYIGRPGRSSTSHQHYGNPFSHLEFSTGYVHVSTREESVERFETWLKGESDLDICQSQRKWILNNMARLVGHNLACWCAPEACHGDVLERLATTHDYPTL